jgi:hypothetical protein
MGKEIKKQGGSGLADPDVWNGERCGKSPVDLGV